jgi:hypothetical protein
VYPLSFTASYEPAGNGHFAEVVVKLNGREIVRIPPITDIAFYAGPGTESRLIEDTLVDWIHRALA